MAGCALPKISYGLAKLPRLSPAASAGFRVRSPMAAAVSASRTWRAGALGARPQCNRASAARHPLAVRPVGPWLATGAADLPSRGHRALEAGVAEPGPAQPEARTADQLAELEPNEVLLQLEGTDKALRANKVTRRIPCLIHFCWVIGAWQSRQSQAALAAQRMQPCSQEHFFCSEGCSSRSACLSVRPLQVLLGLMSPVLHDAFAIEPDCKALKVRPRP